MINVETVFFCRKQRPKANLLRLLFVNKTKTVSEVGGCKVAKLDNNLVGVRKRQVRTAWPEASLIVPD